MSRHILQLILLTSAAVKINASTNASLAECKRRKSECFNEFACKMRRRFVEIRCTTEAFFEDSFFRKPNDQCTEDCRNEIIKMEQTQPGKNLLLFNRHNDCLNFSQRAKRCYEEVHKGKSPCNTVITFCKTLDACNDVIFPYYHMCLRMTNDLQHNISACERHCTNIAETVFLESKKGSYWAQQLLSCTCDHASSCDDLPEFFRRVFEMCDFTKADSEPPPEIGPAVMEPQFSPVELKAVRQEDVRKNAAELRVSLALLFFFCLLLFIKL